MHAPSVFKMPPSKWLFSRTNQALVSVERVSKLIISWLLCFMLGNNPVKASSCNLMNNVLSVVVIHDFLMSAYIYIEKLTMFHTTNHVKWAMVMTNNIRMLISWLFSGNNKVGAIRYSCYIASFPWLNINVVPNVCMLSSNTNTSNVVFLSFIGVSH